MDLLCVIKEVSLKGAANYYIFVQFKDTTQQKAFKFRTEIVPKTEHPKFHRNTFTFDKINVEQVDSLSLKFGLFATTLPHESADLAQSDLLQKSVSVGVASMKLSINAVTQLQEKGFLEHSLPFVANKSEIGRIYFAIKVINRQLDVKYRFESAKLDALFYNPFQEDVKMIENNIKKLEGVVKAKMDQYEQVRKKLGTVRALEQKVHLDEDKLRKEVEGLQKQNERLGKVLTSKIDQDSIKAEFELLKDTGKGQALLIQRLLYLKQRIKLEKEEQAELAAKKKQLDPVINKRIDQAERFSKLQHTIKQQRFHMHRGSHLLRIYNELVNQITSNEMIVRNLKELSKKSEFTAKQALIILEHAKYENELLKLTEQQPTKNHAYEIMDKIQGAAKLGEDDDNEQFAYGYEVKLEALKNQISLLENKIRAL